MSVVPLVTARLRIRRLRPADAEALHRIYGDPDAMRYVGREGRPRDRARTEQILAELIRIERRLGFGLWAVVLTAERRMIGIAGVTLVEDVGPDIELVYLLEQAAWGYGYATEAARACLDAAFGPLGLDRVVALAYREKAASIRVMEKLRMRRAGTAEAYGRTLVRYEADATSSPR